MDMAVLEAFAELHNLVLIEDAAQSIGAEDRGRSSGSFGLASCLSFDPTKVIASFSSAGAVVTDDADIAEYVRMLRYHGRRPGNKMSELIGFNSQLATDKAAVLNFKLSMIGDWQAEREAIAQKYCQLLVGIDEIILPEVRLGSTHNWHKFVIQVENRDRLRTVLFSDGIEVMVHYNQVLSDEPCLSLIHI